MSEIPIIRLEVQRLAERVSVAMAARDREFNAMIEAQIDATLKSYPFEAQVTRAVHKALNDAIEAYFTRGEGYHAIRDAVEKSLRLEV